MTNEDAIIEARRAWVEYRAAVNELELTERAGIWAPTLPERVNRKRREWNEDVKRLREQPTAN